MFLRLACLLTASAFVGPLSRAADSLEATILATAEDRTGAAKVGPLALQETGGVVVRSPEDLKARCGKGDAKAMEAELAKALEVEAIDWKSQMVIAVRGEPGTKADRISFDSLTLDGNMLTVGWHVKPRPPHAGPGAPLAVILVDRFDGEVKFAERGR